MLFHAKKFIIISIFGYLKDTEYIVKGDLKMSKNLSKNQIHDLTMLVLNQLEFQEANETSSATTIAEHVVQKYVEISDSIQQKNTPPKVTVSTTK